MVCKFHPKSQHLTCIIESSADSLRSGWCSGPMEEPDEEKLNNWENNFQLHSAWQKMAPPIFLGFNFSCRATHPMSQGIRSKQYQSCIHSCKDSFLRIKTAMNIMNEYIETKVKGKNATKVDGSVYEHLGLSATILQGCIFQQLFNFCQMTWSKYTPPQYPRRPWKLTPKRHIYICSTDASYHIVSTTVKKTLLRQHLYMILSFDSNSGCAMTD